MSQGAELEQTLQMPDVLAVESGFAERMQNFGSRIVELAQQGWDNARRYVPRFALAGLAVTGTVEASPANAATTFHHRSTLTTQAVLNKIHHAIPSGDSTQHHHKILVNSANLHPSKGGFKTDCSNIYASTYRNYEINPYGQTFQGCSAMYVPDRHTTKGQFQNALNNQGTLIRESVNQNYTQQTKSIAGNRKEVKAFFACPPNHKGVSEIVLDRHFTNSGKQYTTATITTC